MAIDFRSAIRYPFIGTNRFQAWLVPSALLLLVQIGSFLLMLLLRHYNPLLEANQVALMLSPFTILANVFLGGFLWHLCGHLKTNGLQAQLPPVQQAMGSYLRDGAKVFLYMFLVNLVFNLLLSLPGLNLQAQTATLPPLETLGILLFFAFLLVPVLVAPIIQAPPDYSLKALFNVARIAAVLKAHYKKALVAMLMVLPVFVIYTVLVALLIMSKYAVVLIPFAIMAMLVTVWHLLTQGLTEDLASWPESGDLRLGT